MKYWTRKRGRKREGGQNRESVSRDILNKYASRLKKNIRRNINKNNTSKHEIGIYAL